MSLRAIRLRTKYLHNPIGISNEYIRFSYELEGENYDNQTTKQMIESNKQTAYQILASSKLINLNSDTGDLWDSEKVESESCYGILYEGPSLSSRQKVYWKIRIWDESGEVGAYSEIASFELGLLEEDDWLGNWIGWGEESEEQKVAVPLLCGRFHIQNKLMIEEARLYISGLGLYEVSCNGLNIDDSFYKPGESDYSRTVYYRAYDITSLIQEEDNVIGVQLGNGQYENYKVTPVMRGADGQEMDYHRYQKSDGVTKPNIYGTKKALVQVEVKYKDGSHHVLCKSDSNWKISKSPTIFHSWYGGEDYDARLEQDGWNKPTFEHSQWDNAVCMEPAKGKLTAYEYSSIVKKRELYPKDKWQLENGNWILDMGINGAGIPILTLDNHRSKAGQKISIFPAEELLSDKSGVDQRSCSQSETQRYHCSIEYTYTCKGAETESWYPSYGYQGFRYLEVRGLSEVEDNTIRVWHLSAENQEEGFFQCSNEDLNEIHTLVVRSIESNMFYSFTDCPHIEKLGWLETSHLMLFSIASSYDIRTWMPKIIKDIRDAQVQLEDLTWDTEKLGYVPAIAPEYHRIVGLHKDVNWSGSCILTPWNFYQVYGDKTVLEVQYNCMNQYMDYLHVEAKDSLLHNYSQMGDWGQINENTPVKLVENCAYYYILSIMVEISDLLGDKEKSDIYSSRKDSVKKAFHKDLECYQEETMTYGNGSQSSYACVLFSKIVLSTLEECTLEHLINKVKSNDYHLSSGEVGLKQVFHALASRGQSELVYRMIVNETAPSYKYFIEKGMTTLPEYWNFEELWYGGVRSRNHAMMGHMKEWLYSHVLGIQILEVAGKRIRIAPSLMEGVTSAKGAMRFAYGLLKVDWIRNGNKIGMNLSIPIGMEIEFHIPGWKESKGRNQLSSGDWAMEFIKE